MARTTHNPATVGAGSEAEPGPARSTTSVQPSVETTRTTVAILTEDIGFERGRAKVINDQVGDLHKKSMFLEWQVITAERGKAAPAQMLIEIGEYGFAWRDVARLVGVSIAAVQKWRKGDGVSGDNRRKIASLLAACDLITNHYGVSEIASWLEMPVLENVPVSPLDLYAAGQHKLLFDFASGHLDPEQTLTEFDPTWRVRYHSDYEVFRAADGELSIRPKS